MSIVIRLDATALTKLVAEDPAFKLELQRAVVAEVVRQTVFKDMPDALKLVSPQLAAEVVAKMRDDQTVRSQIDETLKAALVVWQNTAGGWGRGEHKPKKEIQLVLETEARAVVSREVSTIVDRFKEQAEEMLEQRLQRSMGDFALRTQSRFEAMTKAVIDQGVADRLAAIKAGL